MSTGDGTFDAPALLDDDALLDAIAAGGLVEEGQLGVLAAWHAELVQATPAFTHDVRPLLDDRLPARRHLLARAAAAAATAAAVVAGGGVAAAAVSGANGPLSGLHRIIFGTTTRADGALTRVVALLDDAQRRITAGQRVGQITAAESGEIGAILNRADALIRADLQPSKALGQRLHALRVALAELPLVPGVFTSPERAGERSNPATVTVPPSTPPPSAAHDRNGDGAQATEGAPRPTGSSNAPGQGSSDGGAANDGGAGTSGSDNGGADNGGADNGGSDNGGSDNGGSNSHASSVAVADNGGSDNGG